MAHVVMGHAVMAHVAMAHVALPASNIQVLVGIFFCVPVGTHEYLQQISATICKKTDHKYLQGWSMIDNECLRGFRKYLSMKFN